VIIAVAFAWLAALYRICITIRPPYTMWRTSFTAAITLVAVGGTFFVFPGIADRATPNLSSLMVHLSTTLSGGCVLIYVLTLNYYRPPRRLLWAVLVSAAVVVSLQIATWLTSPIHAHDAGDLGDTHPNADLLFYFLSYYAYVGVGMAVTSASCVRQAIVNKAYDHSARVGLFLIAVATFLGSFALGCYASRVSLTLTSGPDYESLSDIGDSLAPFSFGGISLGTVVFLLGPPIASWHNARLLIRQLSPLHERLCARYPEITIDMGRTGLTLQKERMLIEIHDGLQRVMVADQAQPDPYHAIVAVLVGSHRPRLVDSSVPASRLLPSTTSRDADHNVLLALADTLEEASSA